MENEIRYTKGPWQVKHSESKPAFNVVGTALGRRYKIARCPITGFGSTYPETNKAELIEVEANAKLIASAPELLAALKEAKEVLLQLDHRHNGKCYNPTENDCNCTLCTIDKVLKKAE